MIHSTAVVDASANLANGVSVGPFTVIGADVEIGEDTWIGPHAVINGPTKIGARNRIFQFASVGEACQDLKYAGEPTRLIIGDDNTIREGATLHRGTVQDQGETRVGNHCLLMANTHVAHDCVVGDQVIMANNSGLAGHCRVGDYAILGGTAGVHQHCQIGAHAFVGLGSMVLKDIPAFVVVQGYPASAHGINAEGLKRRGFSDADIADLRAAYRIIYRSSKTVRDAVAELTAMAAAKPHLQLLIDSIQSARRGIVR